MFVNKHLEFATVPQVCLDHILQTIPRRGDDQESSRVTLTQRLPNTKWGASADVLGISMQALVSSADNTMSQPGAEAHAADRST